MIGFFGQRLQKTEKQELIQLRKKSWKQGKYRALALLWVPLDIARVCRQRDSLADPQQRFTEVIKIPTVAHAGHEVACQTECGA